MKSLPGAGSPLKIILGGPPRSGKSCLRFALREALMARSGECPYPYVITACPDGEGAWFHEAAVVSPEMATRLKVANRAVFTDAHAELYAQAVRDCTLPLALIDVGGRIDDKNRRICAPATHAILMARGPGGLDPWRALCRELGLCILAEVESIYQAAQDGPLTLGEDGVYRGSIHRLERGDRSLPSRPTVQALADVITRYFTHPKP